MNAADEALYRTFARLAVQRAQADTRPLVPFVTRLEDALVEVLGAPPAKSARPRAARRRRAKGERA